MAKNPLLMRVGTNRRLLLLGSGKIALAKQSCVLGNWHVAIKTESFQHPGCIDFKLTNNRAFSSYPNTDTSKYSRCYIVASGVGEFTAQLRWGGGHSPYPQIKNMEVWCFGIYLGNRSYPKAGSAYTDIAHVTISENAQVTVNGMSAGFWRELL